MSPQRCAPHRGTRAASPGCSVKGFASIAALFVLVVIAGLGAFVVWTTRTQQLGAAQDLRGSHADWAARAGIEWALAGLAADATRATCPTPPSPFEVDGFHVVITCAVNSYDEAGAPALRVFRIDATATAGGAVGSLSYVERSRSVTVAHGSLATQ